MRSDWQLHGSQAAMQCNASAPPRSAYPFGGCGSCSPKRAATSRRAASSASSPTASSALGVHRQAAAGRSRSATAALEAACRHAAGRQTAVCGRQLDRACRRANKQDRQADKRQWHPTRRQIAGRTCTACMSSRVAGASRSSQGARRDQGWASCSARPVRPRHSSQPGWSRKAHPGHSAGGASGEGGWQQEKCEGATA